MTTLILAASFDCTRYFHIEVVGWSHSSSIPRPHYSLRVRYRLHIDQTGTLKHEAIELKKKVQTFSEVNAQLEKQITESVKKLAKQEHEFEKAKERIAIDIKNKVAQGDRLMLSATGVHDYASRLSSPSKLVNSIEFIEDQTFANWIRVALEEHLEDSDIPWLASEDAAKAVGDPRNHVLQVLVETVRECHRRVCVCVSKKTEQIQTYMDEILGTKERGTLAGEVARFERSAFHEGYTQMFAALCPDLARRQTDCTDLAARQTELAQETFKVLPVCVFLSNVSSDVCDALFNHTRKAYEELVTSLLKLFLECEIRRTDPLEFSNKFACEEVWDPKEHKGDTFDPSYIGGKLVEGSTMVQVVIPRLFWEKEADGKVTQILGQKASFVIRNAPTSSTTAEMETN